MTEREFVEAFADLAKINPTRSAQLVKYFKALIEAGVHSSGSVQFFAFGSFTNRWWQGHGQQAHMQPVNRLRFKPSPTLVRRMSRWAGAPISRKERGVTRAGHVRPADVASPDLSPPQYEHADHGPE